MRKTTKLAAALAVVLTVGTFAGCEEKTSAPAPAQSGSVQSVQSRSEQSKTEQQSAQSSSAEQSAASQAESLTEEQYKAKVIDCTAQWFNVYGTETVMMFFMSSNEDYIKTLSQSDRDKLKKEFAEYAEKCESALAPLEDIVPPREMTEFHGEFLKFEKIMRLYNNTLREIAQTDLEDTSSIESIGESFQNKAESFDIDSFMKNYKWFADGVENSDIIRKNPAVAEYTEKSNVTSADSDAKTVMYAVNVWIVDNMNNGGKAFSEGTVKISWSGGEVSVSGAITDADKANNTPQTLTEHLKENFRGLMNGYAEVYLNADGKAFAAIYALDASSLDSAEHPVPADFEKGSWKWNGKTAGVTASGQIIGTSPKLALDPEFVSSNNDDTGPQLASDYDEDTLKSVVTSADSMAKEITLTVNSWITDNVAEGGNYPKSGELTIVRNNDNTTLTGVIKDSDVAFMQPTLAETFNNDYPHANFFAKVRINEEGKADKAVLCEKVTELDQSEYPDWSAFEEGSWKWKDKTPGVSPSGYLIGTSPKVTLKIQ